MASLISIFGGSLATTILKVILAILLGGGGLILAQLIKKWKADQANRTTDADKAKDQGTLVPENNQIGKSADDASSKVDQDLDKMYPKS